MSKQELQYEYLCVDKYLSTFVDTQVIKCSIELGVIDYLAVNSSSTLENISENIDSDIQGLQLLIELLVNNKVVEISSARVALTERFRLVWSYRDLLLAKIEFANLVAPDLIDQFTAFITKPDQFMQESRIFSLFDYYRALNYSAENYQYTERWMRLTTVLTRYEAQACLDNHDFSTYEEIMDIGGNSGEFSLQIAKRYKEIKATIIDLPVVCEVGKAHVSTHLEASRIKFIAANALNDVLPKDIDLVTFKSMLHDWPETAVKKFVEQAYSSLRSGGEILIFERSEIPLSGRSPLYSNLPTFLFFRSYRTASKYETILASAGFDDIQFIEVILETPFILITGKKV